MIKKMMLVAVAALMLGAVFQTWSQSDGANSKPPRLGVKWQALVGDWSGEGGGSPGSGGGTSSFKFDLQQQILVRRGHSEYPAADGHPATVHDDLMIIYPTAGDDQSRATYFDNEGHVIEYNGNWSAAGDALTFVSKPSPSAPQFRLVYKKVDAGTWTISFEIAPPGQAGAFKPYVSGRLKRNSAP